MLNKLDEVVTEAEELMRMIDNAPFMWRKMIDGQFVVVCHYALRTWERAHYGSWNLHGHSHGTLEPVGKQMDVGVDSHHFRPVSFEVVKAWMGSIPILHGSEHDMPDDFRESTDGAAIV